MCDEFEFENEEEERVIDWYGDLLDQKYWDDWEQRQWAMMDAEEQKLKGAGEDKDV